MQTSLDSRSDDRLTPRGLEGDAEGARVVAEELRLLSVVRGAMRHAAGQAVKRSAEDEARRRLIELRAEIEGAKVDDLPALFDQMHALHALRDQRAQRPAGAVDPERPYFAHLRVEEGGRRRDLLIGGGTYIDPAAGVRVVDWRSAPSSQIYYRYSEGDDYEEEIGERMASGVVLAKRNVTIDRGELRRVACPAGTFVRDDEGRWRRVTTTRPLLRAAGVSATLGADERGELHEDKHLPAIAALLDAEQFKLIQSPSAGLLAVQGSAGSGKTTVGLHRVAYLSFAEPERFRADRMLIVMPTEALVHYVGRVLPSLGVRAVPVTTFARWALPIVGRLFPKLPKALCAETPPVVSRAKTSPAMLRGLDNALTQVKDEITHDLEAVMARVPRGSLIVDTWREIGADRSLPFIARMGAFLDWYRGKRAIGGAKVPSDLAASTRTAFENIAPELRKRARAVTTLWRQVLCDRASLGQAFAGSQDFSAAQLDQVCAWAQRQRRLHEQDGGEGDEPTLDAEDLVLLLRAHQMVRGPLLDEEGKPLRYAHIFVDEVQDMSVLDLGLLIELAGEQRSVTLAGDAAQRLFGEESGEFAWDKLFTDLGVSGAAAAPLRVSYRSTAEITVFARKVLGPFAHEEEPVTTRSGPPVELFQFASPGEAVAFLADQLIDLARAQPLASVALIARFVEQADLYYEGLARAGVPRLRRVTDHDFSWRPGVEITDVRQVKGLEFDDVVLLDVTAATYPDAAPARRALYTAATRAAEQLWCIASDAPSPIALAALSEACPGRPSP